VDEEIIVIAPKSRRYKCVLSAAEMDQMLAHRISWGGLGMYATMCEYEPETLFTVDELAGLASNTRGEVAAILDELISAGYVFRTDMRVEGQAAYVVNRDLLPESITDIPADEA
jgi:hypothetical protein